MTDPADRRAHRDDDPTTDQTTDLTNDELARGSTGPPEPAPVVPSRPVDPVRQRRARVATLVSTGQRVGYGLFAAAVVGFFVGFVVGFDQAVVDLIVGCIIVGSLVLAPSIVFSYAVKAAERDDLEHGR